MTVSEIVKLTGCKNRHIQNVCRKLGYRKVVSSNGRWMRYDLTDAQVKKLIENLYTKRGRPANITG